MSVFSIPQEEYEEKRHIFDLCRWINDKMSDMEKEADFDRIYHERRGEGNIVKRIIEEAIPISRLGLHLSSPAKDVYIQCLAGSQSYDAILEVTGFSNYTIKVEATTTETDETTMRRQALASKGFAYMSGPVHRQGREIIFEPEMVDMDEEEQKWADVAFERCLSKLEKSYGPETAILVNVLTAWPVSLDSRANLIRRTRNHLFENGADIYGVYYSYPGAVIVDGIPCSNGRPVH